MSYKKQAQQSSNTQNRENEPFNLQSKLKRGPVLYISSPIALSDTSSFDYFVSIINFLSLYVYTCLEKELIVKVPVSNNAMEQITQLERAIDSCEKEDETYSAIIIAPMSSKDLKQHIKENFDKYKNVLTKIPIYSIDKKVPKLDNNFQLPYITGDWFTGGKLAGQAALEWIQRLDENKRKNKVLVVRGKEGSESRIRGFNQYLKDNASYVNIHKTKVCLDYSREDAFNYLSTNKKRYNLNSYDVIFCCNDEMALGVRELLLREKLSTKNLAIIGFDATIEFEWLKKYEQNHLYKTVNVMIEEQIKTLVTKIASFDLDDYLKHPGKYNHTNNVSI